MQAWELRLNLLAETAPAVAPPARVWERILQRLGPAPVRESPLARWWNSLGFWRGAGLLAMAATAALALYIGQMPAAPGPSYIAVLIDADKTPILVAKFDAETSRLSVRSLQAPAADPAHSHELWMVAGGNAPRSLGLLGDTETTVTLICGPGSGADECDPRHQPRASRRLDERLAHGGAVHRRGRARQPLMAGVPTTGFLLGKFLPPHRGHQYLIEFARNYVDRLTVLVCTIEQEPIPGRLRYQWMCEAFPGVDLVHHTDEIPQAPEEHPQFWDIWRNSIRRHVPGRIDYVFASEDYGERLAAELGARFVPVDRERRNVPVSGRAIRQDPLAHWDELLPPVRPYYLKRVCVCELGQSGLVDRLAAHFHTVCVHAYESGAAWCGRPRRSQARSPRPDGGRRRPRAAGQPRADLRRRRHDAGGTGRAVARQLPGRDRRRNAALAISICSPRARMTWPAMTTPGATAWPRC